jgi:hypothetical protein
MSQSKLCIGVYSCFAQKKFIDQSIACHQTWEKHARKFGVNVFYYVDQNIDSSVNWDNIIQLKNVGDDYESAFQKHFKGLKQMYETVVSDWYFSAGSDTYLNIENTLKMLNKYDCNQPRVIAGCHGYSDCLINDVFFEWYSGGGGYFVSRSALDYLIKYFDDNLKKDWHELCENVNCNHVRAACDVCFFYLIRKYQLPIQIDVEKEIHSCSDKGQWFGNELCPPPWCCKPNRRTLITCHFMTPERSHDYYNFWENEIVAKQSTDLFLLYENAVNPPNQAVNPPSQINKQLPILYQYSQE